MVFELDQYIVNPYLRSLFILVLFTTLFGIAATILSFVIKRITSKTETNVDDEFVNKATKPLAILVFLLGIKVAFEELPFSEGVLMANENVLWSVIIINIAVVSYYFVDIILFVALKRTMGGTSSVALKSLTNIVHGVLKVVLVSVSVLYILEVWGIEIGPFLATLGIAGLAIALALQPALANIFSGMSLILDKSVKMGDLIYLDDKTGGRVVDVGLRSIRILTFDNELIIVPNSKVADSRIQNIGEPDPKARVVVPFGVAYGSDIEKVKKLITKELRKIEHFIDEPEPSVMFLEMADSSLKFKAYFYVDNYENRWGAIDEANTKIYNALNKAGISIPFPQMDLHIKENNYGKRK